MKSVDVDKSFKAAYRSDLSHIDEVRLVESVLMVENLAEALEKAEGTEEDPSIHTGSLSEESVDGLREQLETLTQEKKRLRVQCQELEKLVAETRRESDIWKLKLTMAMGNMRSKIDCLEEDKQYLIEKCTGLESKLVALRIESISQEQETGLFAEEETKEKQETWY